MAGNCHFNKTWKPTGHLPELSHLGGPLAHLSLRASVPQTLCSFQFLKWCTLPQGLGTCSFLCLDSLPSLGPADFFHWSDRGSLIPSHFAVNSLESPLRETLRKSGEIMNHVLSCLVPVFPVGPNTGRTGAGSVFFAASGQRSCTAGYSGTGWNE